MFTENVEDSPLLASVIIVNYNGESYLKRLFESLCSQSLSSSMYEVIFVDNSSTDNSLKILNQNKEKYASLRIRIIINSTNSGFIKGNNIGLKYSRGKYLVLLNNDTYVEFHWLEELLEVMEKNPTVGICESAEIVYETDGNTSLCLGVPFGILRRSKEKKEMTKTSEGLVEGFFYSSGACLAIRRDIIDKFGRLFDERDLLGDLDLSWEVRLLGFRILSNQKSICHHFYGHATRIVYKKQRDQEYMHFHDNFLAMFKNYSFKRLMKRFPIYFITSIFTSLFRSIQIRKPVVWGLARALIWNFINLRGTLVDHYKIDRIRKISDDDIESFMLPYPNELYYLKLKLSHK